VRLAVLLPTSDTKRFNELVVHALDVPTGKGPHTVRRHTRGTNLPLHGTASSGQRHARLSAREAGPFHLSDERVFGVSAATVSGHGGMLNGAAGQMTDRALWWVLLRVSRACDLNHDSSMIDLRRFRAGGNPV
jgi:hypothetical protein